MLEVRNLEVVHDDVMPVLRGVSPKVPAGSVVALLGANGAGKTTLLRALSGLLDVHDGEVTKGSVTLDGEPAQGAPNGVTMVKDFYAGPTARSYVLDGPCFAKL